MENKSGNAKSWQLGDFRTTTNGKKVFVVAPDVTITAGGREIDLGQFRTLYLNGAEEDLAFRTENGYVDAQTAEKLRMKISEKQISHVLRAKFKGN